jgi:streptogramin lyase
MTSSTFVLAILVTAAVCCSAGAQPEGFRLHARFQGIGACLKTLIGPGPEPGSQRLYASHIYGGDTLDIVATDPLTGQTDVFPGPLPGECGAWAMALGPDGQVYVGTLSAAHVLRVDWATKALVDLGRPSETESYIWQLALGTDDKLYGCTYPNAKLVRFDPATGRGEDLGRMDPTEGYARSVAADDHGFVYVGVGPSKAHIVAYEIATGEHRDILPPEASAEDWGNVVRAGDGAVYGSARGKTFRLAGWEAVPIPPEEAKGEPPLTLADGRLVSYDGPSVSVTDPATGQVERHETGYRGKSQDIFRIGLGPDDRLYASTAMPIHFFWADPDSDAWEELGQPGGGEFYSFLAHGNTLLGAAYSGAAPLMVYDPERPYAPSEGPTGNPRLVHYDGENSGWRPMAMIAGPDDKVYIGAVSGYGLLGGPLCIFDPATGSIEQFLHLIPDQSVVALALLPDGLLVGGTSIGGGGGSHPTQTEAKLFLWDPATKTTLFETVPVPGDGTIVALAVGKDGLVYGFTGSTQFVFDPATRDVIDSAPHELGSVVFNAVIPGPEGELYGLASGGIFRVDTATRRPRILAAYPDGIDGGFAVRGRAIYFTSGPQIVSYTLPDN